MKKTIKQAGCVLAVVSIILAGARIEYQASRTRTERAVARCGYEFAGDVFDAIVTDSGHVYEVAHGCRDWQTVYVTFDTNGTETVTDDIVKDIEK